MSALFGLSDFLAIITLLFWLIIPIFWIPVHVLTNFFKKIGLFTYLLPLLIWLPVAFHVYTYKAYIVQLKISLPMIVNLIGVLLLVIGLILHIWTAKLLGLWGIIGVPEISSKVKRRLITKGLFSKMRHPTYFAHTLIFLGVFLLSEVVVMGIATIIDFIIVNTVIIPIEERELINHFGEEYRLYREKVPRRFFPNIRIQNSGE